MREEKKESLVEKLLNRMKRKPNDDEIRKLEEIKIRVKKMN